MHLVLNAAELGRGRGGNETYIAGLIEGLAVVSSPLDVTLLTCEWGCSHSPGVGQVNLGGYRPLPFFLWQQTLALRRLEADWYLANYYLPPLLPCKGAVIVHDLSFRAHPGYFPLSVALYMRLLTAWAVRRAELVLTVSAFSRQELLRFFPVVETKVCVVPNGVGSEFRLAASNELPQVDREVLSKYKLASPYILAVGNIHPRKNLSRLLDAYLQLRRSRRGVPDMVWVGAPRWGSHELLQRARSSGVTLTGFVPPEDLPALYRNASMLVYPSLYEGFGLPPVEAMACGTPVVTSNTTSLPEVVGEAALTVDPRDAGAIAGAMGRLLDDDVLREELIDAGIRRARKYTWPRAAKRLLAALDSACYNRP